MGWSPQVLVLVLLVTVCPSKPDICDYLQCNCTTVAGKWINAVCVFNSSQRQLDITPDSLPRGLAELEVSGPRELVLDNGSFSRNLSGLNLVRLADVGRLTVERRAFARLAHPHLRLEVSGVQRLIVESGAFFELRGSVVSARLERVDHLIIQENAFDRLLDLQILNVGLLELRPNAFFYSPDTTESQGPATKITLDRVKIEELPYNVFPPLNHLSILNSEVGVVRNSSFRALILTSVRVANTTVRLVETEAFTTRSGIELLELDGVTVGRLQPFSIQSGITHLSVRGSSVSEVSEAAFHTSAATVSLTDNVFDRVRSRGFTFLETTSLTVENNRFNILEDSAFILPEGESPGQPINITFKGNSLGKDIGKVILNMTRSKKTGAQVSNNGFDHTCECGNHMKDWLKDKINGSDTVLDTFYSTSLCHISADLSRCFGIPRGSFLMENFTELACSSEDQYFCPDVVQSDSAIPSMPGMTSDITYEKSLDREKKLIGSIVIFILSGIIVMLFFSGLLCLRRKGYCTKARLLLLPSADSLFNIISRMFVGTSSTAAPVNRMSVHEYAELQQAQKLAGESVEEDISIEDKATQTLPEELTQELLQTLREKLDDPDNYSEARDMIEHLYDLIKVEESCNQNSDFISLQLEELEDIREGENIYDIIQPKVKTKTSTKEKKCLVSVGTRAPSPDKLLPLSLTKRKAVLCDYMEPRDRQQHVYQELPATQPSASVLCDYAEPPDTKPHVYLEIPCAMMNRPLPSKPDPGEGPSSQ